ncbi:hypothetical protein ACTOB_001410 [Actinoplanes oblitus]|uniref:Uncharacterized protein n=1 Tax=Actinoplanes oblitus TaxID=3040509 RepID=A0ABY8WJ66_9ACTN|nr:hypothetical protein [Actinoplanes oblitus]WIM97855.1 hypothetical protein ACTOB_001410 [Actinoplanes oblitus]
MERRDYPAGVIFHAPHCIEGGNSPAVEIDIAMRTYPSHQLHFCFGGVIPAELEGMAPQDIVPFVTVEQVEYGRHEYQPSDRWPDDAVRALCRVCQGTHGDAAPSGPAPQPPLRGQVV